MDLDDSILPVAKDRAARVFAMQNTTTVSQNREAIQAEVTKEVSDAVRDLFGIEPHSLQIASSQYSNSDFSAMQATGPPESEGICDDRSTNWSPLTSTSGPEWIELSYQNHVRAARGLQPAGVRRAGLRHLPERGGVRRGRLALLAFSR